MKKIFTVFCMTLLLVGFMASVVTAASPAPVPLLTAGNYVILAKSGISSVPPCTITGDIGVSPIHGGLTGWSETMDASNIFSRSAQVTGKLFAADPYYSAPTPANLTQAVLDMQAAYTDAAGRDADYTDLYGGDISGTTLTPGVYKWNTVVSINGNVTLYGGPNDVWIFQTSGDITQASGTRIILTGGAQASNIFWQAAGVVDLGTTSHFEGIVLGATKVTLNTDATVTGRLFAQTAVTLIMNTITPMSPVPVPIARPLTCVLLAFGLIGLIGIVGLKYKKRVPMFFS